MDMYTKRKVAAICLCILPFMYWLGLILYSNQFEVLSRLVLMGWMAISLLVGLVAALTYKNQIFGLNCGSFLCWSVAVIMLVFTLQVFEYAAGRWFMYGLFIFSFSYGVLIIFRTRSKG